MKPFGIVLLFAVIAAGCQDNARVESNTILLPDGISLTDEGEKPFRWIHYDDARRCSTCLLKQYYLWDELILQMGEDKIDYYFLLEPRKGFTEAELDFALSENYFSHSVYYDWAGIFQKENGIRMPSGSVDILTDKSGKVLMVGDLRNHIRYFDRVRRVISAE